MVTSDFITFSINSESTHSFFSDNLVGIFWTWTHISHYFVDMINNHMENA